VHSKLNSQLTFENFYKVDVVRQQIIFRTVRDLRECLDTIASDPEATILRHKNRLSLDHDAVQSAGVLQRVAACCSVLHDDVFLSCRVFPCCSLRCSVFCSVVQCV